MRVLLFVLPLLSCSIFHNSLHAQNYNWTEQLDSLIESKEFSKGMKILDSLVDTNKGVSELSYLYNYKGDIYYYKSEYKKAIEFYLLALVHHERTELPDAAFVVRLNSYIGDLYLIVGLPDKALTHFERAVGLVDIKNDTTSYIDGLAGIASSNAYMGNYNEALNYYQKSFALNLIRNDSLGVSYDLNDIAYVQSNIGNIDQSIHFYKESLKYLDSAENPRSYALKLNNLGMTYLRKGKDHADSAEWLVKRSYEIFKLLNDPTNTAKRLLNLSDISRIKGDLSQAEIKLKEAVQLGNLTGLTRITIFNSWAELLFKNGQYNRANSMADSSINLASSLRIYPYMQKPLELKRNIALHRNNYEAAFQFQKQYQQIKDSAVLENNQKLAQNLALEYDLHKKKVEIDLLSARTELAEATVKSQRTQNFLIVTILLIVVISSAILILIQRQKFNLKNQLLGKEVDELRWKINALIDGDPKQLHLSLDDINSKLDNTLTEREFKIFELALTDRSNRQIAEEVFVSVNTVKYHLKNIYEKLGVSNRNEVLQFLVKTS